jgi:glutamine amidotransferase
MIAIIDYNAGNLKSVERALRKLGFSCSITHTRKEILLSERVIFPGVFGVDNRRGKEVSLSPFVRRRRAS